MKRHAAAILAVSLASLGTAQASELFSDDFEDMGAHRWHVGGDGTVEVENFDGSEALRFTKRGYAMAAVRIDGEFKVSIQVSMRAESLEAEDHCVAEASADGGAIWTDILRLVDGDDALGDWQTGDENLMLPGPMSTLVIRLRSEGDSNSDICWADNVVVMVQDAMRPDGE